MTIQFYERFDDDFNEKCGKIDHELEKKSMVCSIFITDFQSSLE